jgi:hypothetical protein
MAILSYETAANFINSLGISCPHPADLIRGGIIGSATVTAIVKECDSPWFFGPRGLLLSDARPVEPIPSLGALGYFEWRKSGEFAEPNCWMEAWPHRLGVGKKTNESGQKRQFLLLLD